ncbi:hypothetical protein J6590_011271 [Homalodisca vitripennis]|nr:hypothetical protein J6590_011271 [Homalodisca vitripennis]
MKGLVGQFTMPVEAFSQERILLVLHHIVGPEAFTCLLDPLVVFAQERKQFFPNEKHNNPRYFWPSDPEPGLDPVVVAVKWTKPSADYERRLGAKLGLYKPWARRPDRGTATYYCADLRPQTIVPICGHRLLC